MCTKKDEGDSVRNVKLTDTPEDTLTRTAHAKTLVKTIFIIII